MKRKVDLSNLEHDKTIVSKLIQYKFSFASPNSTLSGTQSKNIKVPIAILGKCQLFGEEAFQNDFNNYYYNTTVACKSLEGKFYRCTLQNFWIQVQKIPKTFEDFCIHMKEKIRRLDTSIANIIRLTAPAEGRSRSVTRSHRALPPLRNMDILKDSITSRGNKFRLRMYKSPQQILF